MSDARQVPESLESLLEAYYRGDDDALCALHVQLRRPLEYHAWVILHDREEAEDAVQETFVKLANSRTARQFEAKNVKAMLYSFCTHWCIDRLRRRKVNAEPSDDNVELLDLDDAAECNSPYSSIRVAAWEARYLLDTLLADSGLTGNERRIVELRLAEDNNKIAEIMGLHSSTTSNLWRAAKDKMLRRANKTPNGKVEKK